MRYARVISNYSHRGLTKVRDEHNLHPLFDLVQPGQCFPYAYGYDERSEAQIAVLSRYGIVDLLDEPPAKADVAPQYFDERVLATLPDEFRAEYGLLPTEDGKPKTKRKTDEPETIETEE